MNEIIYNVRERAWQSAAGYPPGAEAKVLREGGNGIGWTILLKLPPGWSMNAHSHRTTEQHYVLEGEYEIENQVFSVGSYQLIPEGTCHGPFFTRTGAVLLVVWDPAD